MINYEISIVLIQWRDVRKWAVGHTYRGMGALNPSLTFSMDSLKEKDGKHNLGIFPFMEKRNWLCHPNPFNNFTILISFYFSFRNTYILCIFSHFLLQVPTISAFRQGHQRTPFTGWHKHYQSYNIVVLLSTFTTSLTHLFGPMKVCFRHTPTPMIDSK